MPTPTGLQKFRKVFLIILVAVFGGLPFGILFLNFFPNDPSYRPLHILVLLIFSIAGGLLGNWIANKGDRYENTIDPDILERRERRNLKILKASNVVIPIFLLVQIFFSSRPSIFSLVISALAAFVFFIAWLRYDPKKSATMKKLYRNWAGFLTVSFIISCIIFVLIKPTSLPYSGSMRTVSPSQSIAYNNPSQGPRSWGCKRSNSSASMQFSAVSLAELNSYRGTFPYRNGVSKGVEVRGVIVPILGLGTYDGDFVIKDDSGGFALIYNDVFYGKNLAVGDRIITDGFFNYKIGTENLSIPSTTPVILTNGICDSYELL